jgi:adenylate cyclase
VDVSEQLAQLVDQVVDVGEPKYTRVEVAEKAGMKPEVAHRFWRASGFPEVGDEVVMFSEADIEILAGIRNLLDSGIADMDIALEITRAIGLTSSRLAAAEIAVLRERTSRPTVTEEGVDPEAATEAVELARAALPFLQDALIYLWRRHLSANAKRALMSATQDQPLKVTGFIDMTGFSRESRDLDASSLESLIDRFEQVTFDVVAGYGGRIVKLIGDEVMFVADDVLTGAAIALELVEQLEREPDVPPVRGGLSFGPVVEIQGDVFGQTVNTASRLADAAKPGTIVVSESFKDALGDAEHLSLRRIRRITMLKGIGRVKAYALRPAEEGAEDQVVP